MFIYQKKFLPLRANIIALTLSRSLFRILIISVAAILGITVNKNNGKRRMKIWKKWQPKIHL